MTTDVVWPNGHNPDCAYIRGLDDVLDESPCTCKDLDDDFWDEDDDEDMW